MARIHFVEFCTHLVARRRLRQYPPGGWTWRLETVIELRAATRANVHPPAFFISASPVTSDAGSLGAAGRERARSSRLATGLRRATSAALAEASVHWGTYLLEKLRA